MGGLRNDNLDVGVETGKVREGGNSPNVDVQRPQQGNKSPYHEYKAGICSIISTGEFSYAPEEVVAGS